MTEAMRTVDRVMDRHNDIAKAERDVINAESAWFEAAQRAERIMDDHQGEVRLYMEALEEAGKLRRVADDASAQLLTLRGLDHILENW